jgi:SAM-dependent methyltransferase
MSITAQETVTYREIHALPSYAAHSPGAMFLPIFRAIAPPPASVLDAGCGSGKGLIALAEAGYQVMGCDLVRDGLVPEAQHFEVFEHVLWHPMPMRADYVYCTDVMEHIPTTFTMLVIARLLEASLVGAFFSIALRPDVFGHWVGTPLHQSVRRYEQWLEDFRELGQVQDARDLGGSATFFVVPR